MRHEPENGGRVTNARLHESLWALDQKVEQRLADLPTKRQMYKAIGVALVIGQVADRWTSQFDEWVSRVGELIAIVLPL